MMLTAGNGHYDFTDLAAGAYCVAVDASTLPAGFTLTTANEPLTVNLASAQDYNTADFGYRAQCTQGALNLAMVRGAKDQANAVVSDRGDFTCVEIKPGAKLALSKVLISSQPAYLGQELSFTIRITNTGSTPLATLPLQDWYDPTTLEFLGATPAPSTSGSGTLAWADLTTNLGDIAPNQAVAVVTRFRALKATTTVSLAAASAALAPEAAGEVVAVGAPDLVSPNWSIEVWPSASCSGWQILFQRASGTAAENWRAKVDGTIIASGATNGNNQTITGTWPSSLDLMTSHTFLAEIYEGSLWLGRSATFGNCPAPATGSIGDRVFYDLNGSGLPDGGSEPGINGVTVRLFSNTCTDTPLKTVTTAGNGTYSFTSLVAGTYCVNANPSTVPAGYQLTTGNMPLTVSLATGQNYTTADFGYRVQCLTGTPNLALVKGAVDATGTPLKDYQSYACAEIQPARASIGDLVWNDANGNGVRDYYTPTLGLPQLEPSLESAVVALTLPGGSVITQTTTITGYYQFTGLGPGQYAVDVIQVPAGYFTTTNNHPQTVNLAAGQVFEDADFGYAGKGLISGVVFYDWNHDGSQGLGEDPIPNTEICLYKDNNRNGQLDSGDTKLTCMFTDSGGLYAFASQVAGAYLVVETQPAGLENTTPNVLPVALVIVGPGGSATDNNFGEIVYVRLGDMVYVDLNGNGLQD
ncbi:MAG: SdrD B-like domain-containing protein, partial [Actinomycetes bacterium]